MDALGWTLGVIVTAFTIVFVFGVLVGLSWLTDEEKKDR